MVPSLCGPVSVCLGERVPGYRPHAGPSALEPRGPRRAPGACSWPDRLASPCVDVALCSVSRHAVIPDGLSGEHLRLCGLSSCRCRCVTVAWPASGTLWGGWDTPAPALAARSPEPPRGSEGSCLRSVPQLSAGHEVAAGGWRIKSLPGKMNAFVFAPAGGELRGV